MSNQICPICGGGGYKSDILNRDCHYCSGSGYIDTDPSIHYVKEEAPQIEFETGNTYIFGSKGELNPVDTQMFYQVDHSSAHFTDLDQVLETLKYFTNFSSAEELAQDLRMKFENTLKNGYNLKI